MRRRRGVDKSGPGGKTETMHRSVTLLRRIAYLGS